MDARLKVSDICHHIGTERRTLQYGFQDVMGMSPQAYIKAVRLNAARKAIKKSNSASHEIGDIAYQLGFSHLSQFAKDYKIAFGELPSETRNRAVSCMSQA